MAETIKAPPLPAIANEISRLKRQVSDLQKDKAEADRLRSKISDINERFGWIRRERDEAVEARDRLKEALEAELDAARLQTINTQFFKAAARFRYLLESASAELWEAVGLTATVPETQDGEDES